MSKEFYKTFYEIFCQNALEIIDDDGAQAADRDVFESTYFQCLATGLFVIENTQNLQFRRDSTEAVIAPMSVRLPKIKLIKFSGNYDEWLSFKDTFLFLIHDDQSLTDLQKFHYLKSSLVGEAAQVINALQLTGANYSLAWSLLQKKYHNIRIITYKHINALFSQPRIMKESAVGIKQLLEVSLQHVRALNYLGLPTQHWDALLIHLITSKLDSNSAKDWELKLQSDKLPTFEDLEQFLQNRYQMLEIAGATYNAPTASNNLANFRKQRVNLFTSLNTCVYCKQSHPLYLCDKFKELSLTNKYDTVRKLKLCSNCLQQSGHFAAQCKSRHCRLCNKKHHTLLHPNQNDRNHVSNTLLSSATNGRQELRRNNATSQQLSEFNVPQSSVATSDLASSNVGVANVQSSHIKSQNHVLLSTALVLLQDSRGNYVTARAILDQGSQTCIMTSSLCKSLGLSVHKINVRITTINLQSSSVCEQTTTYLKSKCDQSVHMKLNFVIMDRITDIVPSVNIDPSQWSMPTGIKLADPSYYVPQQIDILLDASVF